MYKDLFNQNPDSLWFKMHENYFENRCIFRGRVRNPAWNNNNDLRYDHHGPQRMPQISLFAKFILF
jgi:hypothetical protein